MFQTEGTVEGAGGGGGEWRGGRVVFLELLQIAQNKTAYDFRHRCLCPGMVQTIIA